MRPLVVVDRPERWTLVSGDIELVSARAYLSDAATYASRRVQVLNLCRSHRYQSTGYYVSLLAEARGHRPLPSVATMQALKQTEVVKLLSGDLDELIQQSLASIKADQFELSCYFGRNLAERHNRLAAKLFSMFAAPLMRASFKRTSEGWQITGLRLVGRNEIPDRHDECVIDAMRRFVERRRTPPKLKAFEPKYHMAILVDPDEEDPPSCNVTIGKLIKQARHLGVHAETIDKSDYSRLAEFDALLIRTTTNVEHYTYRFAVRAQAEGLVVRDDPASILRCTNKVYLAELLAKHKIKTPATMVLHAQNLDLAAEKLGLPCVLKEPDSAFSAGVYKATTADDVMEMGSRMLESSELIIGQSYTPSEFDWRVGVLGGEVLYVARYFMAPHHWQIAKATTTGGRRYGRTEVVPIDEAPSQVLSTAVKAAGLIGNGLYGVDLKQIGRTVMVIEVNDNPTFNEGGENRILGKELYRAIVRHFVDELDRQRGHVDPTP